MSTHATRLLTAVKSGASVPAARIMQKRSLLVFLRHFG
jgi:hypothetical protein